MNFVQLLKDYNIYIETYFISKFILLLFSIKILKKNYDSFINFFFFK